MALVKHTCPACGHTERVIAGAREVFHYCPAKRLRGRPQAVTFQAAAS